MRSPRIFFFWVLFFAVAAAIGGFFTAQYSVDVALAQTTDFNPNTILREFAGPFTGAQEGQPANRPQDLRIVALQLIRILLTLVGTVFFLMILYSGWSWFSAGGDSDKVERAKKTLRNSIIGLIVISSSYAILTFIFNQSSLTRKSFIQQDEAFDFADEVQHDPLFEL